MCGICGTFGFADRRELERMCEAIKHRGPDDSGVYVAPSGEAGLGSRRLSIIDLSSAGRMPITNEDRSVWLTYNGEIYNFERLRATLMAKGHTFRSKTDSEVIVHGYEEWGVDVLDRLDGMFAFALWDEHRQRLFAARDRFGIKPFYYTMVPGGLALASEAKALLQVRGFRPRLDPTALHRYLAFHWVPAPETMFQGVYKLQPGHYMTWSQDRHEVRSYWDMHFAPDPSRRDEELFEELLALLRSSIRRHLISDVPVGAFLSGGLDSTGIVALAHEAGAAPVKCFTIAFRDEDAALEQSADDPVFARKAAAELGAEYHEITLQPAICDLLEKTVWHLDEPIADPSAIATYLICEAARPDVKVLLSGQGGDEVFAGYRLLFADQLAQVLTRLPRPLVNGPVAGAIESMHWLGENASWLPRGFLLAAWRYLSKLVAGLDLDREERYVFWRSYASDESIRQLYSAGWRTALGDCVAGERHMSAFAAVPDADFLNRMLYVDMKTFLPEQYLAYSDKLSMAASVELRVPYLDRELVEFMCRVPSSLKVRGRTTKYALRKAYEGVVPREVLRRRKAGFGAPIRTWLRRDLKEMVDDLLAPGTVRRRGYFDPAGVRQIIEDDRNGVADNSLRIWALLTLELWQCAFVD